MKTGVMASENVWIYSTSLNYCIYILLDQINSALLRRDYFQKYFMIPKLF